MSDETFWWYESDLKYRHTSLCDLWSWGWKYKSLCRGHVVFGHSGSVPSSLVWWREQHYVHQPVVDSVTTVSWQLEHGRWSAWCMVACCQCVWRRGVDTTLCLQTFFSQWLQLVTIQSWAPFRAETRQKRRDLQTVPGKVTFDSWCLVYSVQLEQTLAGAPFHNVHNYVFAWSWSLPSPLVTTGCSAPSCCVHGVLSCPHRHTTPLTLRTTFLASGWKSAYKKGNNRCVQTMNHLKYETSWLCCEMSPG